MSELYHWFRAWDNGPIRAAVKTVLVRLGFTVKISPAPAPVPDHE